MKSKIRREKMIVEASKTDFAGDIEGNGKTLIFISAPGCSPCKIMKASVLPNIDIKVVTVDASMNIDALKKVQEDSGSITSVPTLVLYEDGEFAARHTGGMSLDQAEKFVG